MHLPWKFSDMMAVRIADYLVIHKDVRPYIHGEELGNPLQTSNSDFEFWVGVQNHKSWGTFTRLLHPPSSVKPL